MRLSAGLHFEIEGKEVENYRFFVRNRPSWLLCDIGLVHSFMNLCGANMKHWMSLKYGVSIESERYVRFVKNWHGWNE
jgi:hypothetical protein